MKPKTFLPEIAVKISDIDKENAVLKGITDRSEEISVIILNGGEKPSKEDFEKFIKEKAKKAVSKTIVDAIAEKLSESSVADRIEQKILSDNPGIIKKPREFTKELTSRLKKEAEKIAEEMYVLDKGMIVKIGGITNENGKVVTARMNFDLSSSKKNPGFYILNVPNDKNPLFKKIPVKLIPTKEKNKYKAVTNSAFTDFEDVKEVLRGYLRTLKAFEEGKVSAKPGTTFNFRESKNPSDEEKSLKEKINHFNNRSIEGHLTYKEAGHMIKDILESAEKAEIQNRIEVFLPLAPVTLDTESLLKEVKEKMMRTSFKNNLSKGFLTDEDINTIFEKTFEETRPIFESFYKLKTEKDRYGFFQESLTLNNIVLYGGHYEKIIDKEKEFFAEKKKEKDIERKTDGIER